MRLAAGVFSVSLMLLLIGYVIGYAVCLWRYKPSPEGQLPEWLEANRIELERSTGTVVMPVLEVPDDFEPPPMLPGD